MRNTRNKLSVLDIGLVAWLILLSGSPSIKLIPGTTYLTGFIGILYFIYYKKISFFKRIYPSILFFSTIFIGQYLTLNYLPIKYPFGLLVIILAGAAIYEKVGKHFREVYLNVIYIFCIISLFFFGIQVISGFAPNLFSIENAKNIVIWNARMDPYNVKQLELRNSGPVWEPGAFAGYILIGAMLYLNDFKTIWNRHRFKFIIIVLAIITTFSSTGYIIIFVIILYKGISNAKHKAITYFIYMPIIIFCIYISFLEIDFIGKKFITQYESALALEGNSFSNTRIGSLLFDIQYIEKHPYFGNGVDPKTRWSDHIELYNNSIGGKNLGHGNGFSGFLASMGILSMVFIIIQLYATFRKSFSISDSLFSIVIFILLLQGESFLAYPLMFCLYFVKLPKSNKISKDERVKNFSNNSILQPRTVH